MHSEFHQTESLPAGSAQHDVELANCRFEILSARGEFLGLGKIWIGGTLVRSGRLPLRVTTQSFSGFELNFLSLVAVERSSREVRIRLGASFKALAIKPMRDHSFDPIHELRDWDAPQIDESGDLDLVLRPAKDSFNGVEFDGFSYHWEYHGKIPLHYLLDQASWELDGDIDGATAYSQSACSAPVAQFGPETAWSTEGILWFLKTAGQENPIMTHNLPRWASHGAFDFQFKGDRTLIGVFEEVDLIRSVVCRDAGKAELKCFDKYIFDSSDSHATIPKKILLHTATAGGSKTPVRQQNLWTWIMDEVHGRARAQFGLAEEATLPRLSHNYWLNYTIHKYFEDMLPAAVSLGLKAMFVDNLNKSDQTTPTVDGSPSQGNMCGGHEYETAPSLGGAASLRELMNVCRSHGIQLYSWTNNSQSAASPLQQLHPDWFLRMEDARLRYGGAYSGSLSIWSFKNEEARRYWADSLKKIKAESGLSGYLFDSFYNMGFMPVDFSHMKPKTHWRELLATMKELQDADIHFLIESFGPFGTVAHGCPTSFGGENLFACYKIGLGSGYTTIPSGETQDDAAWRSDDAASTYETLAHMTTVAVPLFLHGQRIDQLWGEEHRQALADYHANIRFMHRRHLQEDGASVIWHDETGGRATIWNLRRQRVRLQGQITDRTSGEVLDRAESYCLEPYHTYSVAGCVLPVALEKVTGGDMFDGAEMMHPEEGSAVSLCQEMTA